MKSLTPSLQAHLDDGTTTLAWCWRITRADGVGFGFTDHDLTLTFDGTEFEPESGLTASEVRSGSDLSVDSQDAEGVLTSDRITETDILDGLWDNAEVEVWRVNWARPGQRVLLRRGAIGQIRRGRLAFVAEVRISRPCAGSDGRAHLPVDLRCRTWGCALRGRSGKPGVQGNGPCDGAAARPGLHASGLGALRPAGLPSARYPGPAARMRGGAPRCWAMMSRKMAPC